MTRKDDRLAELLRELAARFFSEHSGSQSLLTVTAVELSNRARKATVLMTVLPESEEERAIAFARRRLSDFRKYVHEHSRLARIPLFGVRLDAGEKNRQRMDELGKNL